MTTVVEHFLGNLRRSLSSSGNGTGLRALLAENYKVTEVNEPFLGKHIGDCTVLERIAQGGMSVVYKAKQDVTERLVAVKMLRVQLCCDQTNVKRFEREARAISRLSHANLLNVYHVGRAHTGQPFIVLDYIEGQSLQEFLEANGPLPWERAVGIFSQVCEAMQHAHEQGVIHRDLKPANIMLLAGAGGADKVKVVDFGVVKMTDESQRLSQKLTQTGEVWGSPLYMSPEQCSGKQLDARSDIYSLGTVMYECLTGKPIFTGKHVTELIMRQLVSEPLAFCLSRPDLSIPEWLEAVVLKSLAKEPSRRFRSMYEFKRALQAPTRTPTTGTNVASAQSHNSPTAITGADIAVDPFINKVIGGCYHVQSFIGEGGMSMVYKAVQKGTDRVVAVKVLREELCSQDSYIKRFEREAKSLGRVAHPNLISIYDVGTAHTGQPYMVIEYLKGESLRDLTIANGAMPIKKALPIFTQVCDVMDFAHRQGVIHRDIKPHNIMIVSHGGKEEVVKVVDFGIVKLDENIISVSQKLTASGEICGSPMYMSPEQILDEPLDARTDIYSFGAVMYEVLVGRPLFGGNKITEVMNKHVNVQPPLLSKALPGVFVPSSLDMAIRKSLAKRPDQRFQTMAELKDTLSAIAGEFDRSASSSSQQVPTMPEALPFSQSTTYGSELRPALGKTMEKSRLLLLLVVVAVVASGLSVAVTLWLLNSAATHQSPADVKPEEQQAIKETLDPHAVRHHRGHH